MPPVSTQALSASLSHIRRLSVWLARCCLVLVFGLPVAVLAYWLTADTIGLAVQARLDDLVIQQPLALWQRLAGAGVTLLSLGLLLGGLWQVRRCFQRFAAGHYFELATIRHLRRFAALTCASVVVSFVCTPVLSVLLTLNNAPGHRQLALGVSSEQLFTLFIAGMVWLIAAVMTHASSLAEENAQFV